MNKKTLWKVQYMEVFGGTPMNPLKETYVASEIGSLEALSKIITSVVPGSSDDAKIYHAEYLGWVVF